MQEDDGYYIALVGKYIELQDAYMSVREALRHAAIHLDVEAEILWIHSAELERGKGMDLLSSAHGIIVPGGFGSRGIEGKILAARYAREHKIPYLGLCLGMQVMVIEFGRHVLGSEDANSTEFDRNTPHPVIDLLPEQRGIGEMGGTMRLGLYPCRILEGTLADQAYQKVLVHERHRHRFEFNNTYREIFNQHGMEFSGQSPNGRLVEIAEFRTCAPHHDVIEVHAVRRIPHIRRVVTGERREPPQPIGYRGTKGVHRVVRGHGH